jgi:hypothetical protein
MQILAWDRHNLIFFSLLFEYTRMNTKSTTSWDDFFDNIFISDDEENRDEPEYTYADILAITYGAISGLIIKTSNHI